MEVCVLVAEEDQHDVAPRYTSERAEDELTGAFVHACRGALGGGVEYGVRRAHRAHSSARRDAEVSARLPVDGLD